MSTSDERPTKTPGIDAWLPESYGPGAPFFGLDRSRTSDFFARALPPEPLLTKIRRRLAQWLSPDGGF